MSNQPLESIPPTVGMQAVGLSFSGVKEYAEKSIKLLQDHGDEFIGMIDAGFRALNAITNRDFTTLFAALNDVNRNASTVIDAIKQTFGI